MAVKPIPEQYPRVMPYLYIDGASQAIEFYCEVLGAKERMRMQAPDGKIGHAEIGIGDSVVMLADAFPDIGARDPRAIGGSPVSIEVYVEDVDAVFDRAVQRGATPLRPPQDEFYGDRRGHFEDPFGHRWGVATHVEDVSPEEMEKRVQAAMGGGG